MKNSTNIRQSDSRGETLSKTFSVITFLIFFAIAGIYDPLFAQLSAGGTAPGFESRRWDHAIKKVEIPTPDSIFDYRHKQMQRKDGTALPAGLFIPVQIDIFHENQGIRLSDGSIMFRLLISLKDAPAVGIYFSSFDISAGSQLFIYDWDRTTQLGAYTSSNNNSGRVFAVAPVTGNQVVVEYITKQTTAEFSDLIIGDILYLYPDLNSGTQTEDFGDSEWCQVNVNCPEGVDWQNQKRGVVRILSRVGALAYYCSGSLINNTRNDFTPYVLTADHCARNSQGNYASTQDLMQWVFHFNFEAEECENPLTSPSFQSMVGAAFRANTGEGEQYLGSDFYLVELLDAVPALFFPYFNGWNRSETVPSSGVTIHHPSGDIKKISTYLSPASLATWPGSGANMHLRITWDPTANGHGVTEPGSSGAPLFNQNGLIVGKLTGGGALCSNLFSPDYFGRFASSWEYSPTIPEHQLQHWLDPENTGTEILYGIFYENLLYAAFSADTTVIPTRGAVNFTDQSVGGVSSWQWEFPGGTPSSSTEQNPAGIFYNTTGDFDVTLIISSGDLSDTLVKPNYIRVLPAVAGKLYTDHLLLLIGSHEHNELKWELFDMSGKTVVVETLNIHGLFSAILRFGQLSSGMYVLRVTFDKGSTLTQKIIISN